jgi:hypothetical protein
MQEPRRKGVATHSDPESCATSREGRREALTGTDADQVLSRERLTPVALAGFRGADALDGGGRQHRARRYRETHASHARSQTLRTHRNLSQGNREISRSSALAGWRRPRSEAPGR